MIENGIARRRFRKPVAAMALVLAVAVAGGLAACSAPGSPEADAAQGARTVEQIRESGTIRIGVFSDKSPFGYVDEHGEYRGYDIELARRLADDLGVEAELVSTEAANRVEYLQTGKVDVILANFTVTPERSEVVDFASPYMNVSLGVVSPESAPVTDLSQIGPDDEVIVISGTTAETYLTQEHPEVRLQKYDTYAAAKTAFENGAGVAWANDNTEVMAFAASTEGYVVGIDELGGTDTIAPAVAKGNTDLLDWVNGDLAKLGAERFFHGAYERTLEPVYGADYEETLVVEPGA